MLEHLLLNAEDYSVNYAGQTISMLPKEFHLFQYLYKRRDKVQTREQLLNGVWTNENPSDRTIDDHIYRLRKKLAPWDYVLKLETVWGKGYRLSIKQNENRKNPLKGDKEFVENMHQLIFKYHRFGQGNAIRLLSENKEILGIDIDESLELYLMFVTGNFKGLLTKQGVDEWERLYYLLYVYWYVQFDAKTTLSFFKKALNHQKLPEYLSIEGHLHLFSLYAETGQFNLAYELLKKAVRQIEREQMNDFLPYFRTKELFLYLVDNNSGKIKKSLTELQELLIHNPYLRERGFFSILKGMSFIREGLEKEALAFLTEGVDILRQSGYFPHYLMGIRMILIFVETCSMECRLVKNTFQSLWSDLETQFSLREIEKETFQKLISLL